MSESWTCGGAGGFEDGYAQDWFARIYDMAIFKASGNMGNLDDYDETACPYTLNSTCVGGIAASGQMACFSSWRNPNAANGGDREEPDVVAFSGSFTHGENPSCTAADPGVDIMDMGSGLTPSTTAWIQNYGTSLATPLMAGFTAMLKQACSPRHLGQKLVRAILRTGGWMRNAKDDPYSTSLPQPDDFFDGGGALFAEAALAYCGHDIPGGPFVDSGDDPGPLTPGTLPPGGCENCNDPMSWSGELRAASRSLPPTSGRSGRKIFEADASHRLRITVAWDSCPTDPDGIAPAPLATDYDIFLYEASPTARWWYSSQSVDDSVERFDVDLPENGHYEVYLAWPTGATGCGGSSFEPFAWAAAWWP